MKHILIVKKFNIDKKGYKENISKILIETEEDIFEIIEFYYSGNPFKYDKSSIVINYEEHYVSFKFGLPNCEAINEQKWKLEKILDNNLENLKLITTFGV